MPFIDVDLLTGDRVAERAAAKFSLVTPGAIVALVVWVLASAAFALYVANFGSYNKTYGALGGVIIFLI